MRRRPLMIRERPSRLLLLSEHTLTAKCGLTDCDVCFVLGTGIEPVSPP
jgi:hypothetical protein